MKLELNQPESDHLQSANLETSHHFHHNKLESQIGQNKFFEMNQFFQNPIASPGQHEHTSHLRQSAYAFHDLHLPIHSRDNDILRLVTPGSTSSTSSFESRDESSERPSVIVKLEK